MSQCVVYTFLDWKEKSIYLCVAKEIWLWTVRRVHILSAWHTICMNSNSKSTVWHASWAVLYGYLFVYCPGAGARALRFTLIFIAFGFVSIFLSHCWPKIETTWLTIITRKQFAQNSSAIYDHVSRNVPNVAHNRFEGAPLFFISKSVEWCALDFFSLSLSLFPFFRYSIYLLFISNSNYYDRFRIIVSKTIVLGPTETNRIKSVCWKIVKIGTSPPITPTKSKRYISNSI